MDTTFLKSPKYAAPLYMGEPEKIKIEAKLNKRKREREFMNSLYVLKNSQSFLCIFVIAGHTPLNNNTPSYYSEAILCKCDNYTLFKIPLHRGNILQCSIAVVLTPLSPPLPMVMKFSEHTLFHCFAYVCMHAYMCVCIYVCLLAAAVPIIQM